MPVAVLYRIVSTVTDARRAGLIRIIVGADAVLLGVEARNTMVDVAAPNALQLPVIAWLRIPSQPWLDA